jgi:hypothetical protein
MERPLSRFAKIAGFFSGLLTYPVLIWNPFFSPLCQTALCAFYAETAHHFSLLSVNLLGYFFFLSFNRRILPVTVPTHWLSSMGYRQSSGSEPQGDERRLHLDRSKSHFIHFRFSSGDYCNFYLPEIAPIGTVNLRQATDAGDQVYRSDFDGPVWALSNGWEGETLLLPAQNGIFVDIVKSYLIIRQVEL